MKQKIPSLTFFVISNVRIGPECVTTEQWVGMGKIFVVPIWKFYLKFYLLVLNCYEQTKYLEYFLRNLNLIQTFVSVFEVS